VLAWASGSGRTTRCKLVFESTFWYIESNC
jgi:hypothetical protein